MQIIDTKNQDLLYVSYLDQELLEDKYRLPTHVKLVDAEDISYRKKDGGLQNIPLLATADEKDLSPGTFTALHTGFAEGLIMQCVADFKKILSDQPKAKMLIFSNSISEADHHGKYLKNDSRTSHFDVFVATSDKPEAHDSLKSFKRCPRPAIGITVAMIAEGFDCPQITHMALLDTQRSAVTLGQKTGRVTRVDREVSEDIEQVATIYAVNEPRNLALFESLRSEADTIVVDKISNDDKSFTGGGNSSDVVPVASRVGATTAISLETGQPLALTAIREAAKTSGVVATDQQLKDLANMLTQRSGDIELLAVSVRDQENALRKRIEARVRAVSVKTDRTAHELNSAIKKRYGKSRADMSLAELSQVWSALVDWCEEYL